MSAQEERRLAHVATFGRVNDPRLAVESYSGVLGLSDGPNSLGLAWTVDEADFLSMDIRLVVANQLASATPADVADYHVNDPYGSVALGEAVAAYFSLRGLGDITTTGAGVGSLLYALSRFIGPRDVMFYGDAYVDFPEWLLRAGARVLAGDRDPSSASADAVLFVERPQLLTPAEGDIASVAELAQRAGPRLVIVDESNANYCPPNYSAATLIDSVPNLIVLRGFSKAFGMGGLRLAYCVAPHALTARIRMAIPPLLASALSLRIGRAILEMGDATEALRARIEENKLEVVDLLRALRKPVLASTQYLPYVFVQEGDDVRDLEAAGLIGKQQVTWSSGRRVSRYRLSVPLRADRMVEFRKRVQLLGQHPG